MKKKTQKRTKKEHPSIRFRPELFWDVDPKTIDTTKHARYIIERILEHGTVREVGWLAHRYRKQAIRRVIALPRVQLSRMSKGLWESVFQNK